MTTQLVKLLNYMVNQPTARLTNGLARSRFGVQNLTARIHELRDRGFIVMTEYSTVRGREVTSYRLSNHSLSEARNFLSGARIAAATRR